ncbi:hypothetical protein VNI00_003839 [Paramarasmius palmivorus]|uniref:Sulfotransferase n=1 Tax=Paramarasmius palmivorus TaxID=297713 RepID=A0AAW0DPB1_9AGAR
MGPEYQTPDRDGELCDRTYQDTFENVRKAMEAVEAAGKSPLAMEHPHHLMSHTIVNQDAKFPSPRTGLVKPPMITFNGASSWESTINPTCLPDAFLFSSTPIITIRHPARVLASWVQATYDKFGSEAKYPFLMEKAAKFKWERMIFDSFVGQTSCIVVDGDRLARDPQEQMRALCKALGIDGRDGMIQYTWDATDAGNSNDFSSQEFKTAFLGTLSRSRGIIADKNLAEPIVIANERQGWAREWGEEIACRMEEIVSDAMEDYVYLHQFAL